MTKLKDPIASPAANRANNIYGLNKPETEDTASQVLQQVIQLLNSNQIQKPNTFLSKHKWTISIVSPIVAIGIAFLGAYGVISVGLADVNNVKEEQTIIKQEQKEQDRERNTIKSSITKLETQEQNLEKDISEIKDGIKSINTKLEQLTSQPPRRASR